MGNTVCQLSANLKYRDKTLQKMTLMPTLVQQPMIYYLDIERGRFIVDDLRLWTARRNPGDFEKNLIHEIRSLGLSSVAVSAQ